MPDRDLRQQVAEIASEFGGIISVAVRSIENALDLSVNDDIVLSSASIIKVPIIVEAMRQVAAGRLSLEQEFSLSDDDRVRGAGVMRYLHTGTVLTLKDLLVRIARHEAAGDEWDAMIIDILRHQQDVNRLGLFLPEEARLANKTGSRDGIVHDCGIVTTADFSYAISVFTKDVQGPGQGQMAIARVSRAVYDWVRLMNAEDQR